MRLDHFLYVDFLQPLAANAQRLGSTSLDSGISSPFGKAISPLAVEDGGWLKWVSAVSDGELGIVAVDVMRPSGVAWLDCLN